jgi:gliding motility-associated-like protein
MKLKNQISTLVFLFVSVFSFGQGDDCGSAVSVTDLTGTVCATASPSNNSEITGSCPEGTNQTWFQFTAQGATADFTVTNGQNGWRPEFLIIGSDNNACNGTLFEADCFDQNGNYTSISGQSTNLIIGDTYWVVVSSGAASEPTNGTIEVCVNNPAPPANDDFCSATTITPDGSCETNQTNQGATADWFGGCASANPTVYYEVTLTGANTQLDIDLTTNTFGGGAEILVLTNDDVCPANSGTTIAGQYCGSTGSVISIGGLTAGVTYYVSISTDAGNEGTFDICMNENVGGPTCAQASDDCAAPVVINTTQGVTDCISSCNTGAVAGPDFAGSNCYDFTDATVWFEVTSGAGDANLDITITSTDLTDPYYAVFGTSSGCSGGTWPIIGSDCSGTGGAVSSSVGITPSTTYLIAVSDLNGLEGDFEICATLQPDISLCNIGDELLETASSDPATPVGGPYSPGEVVDFCYTINEYRKENCNWLQGIVPTFGDCWDPSSFDGDGMPLTTTALVTAGNSAGTWQWWPAGSVLYNDLGGAGSLPAGTDVGAGWFFNCTGCGAGVSGTDPDDTWGDGDANGPAQCDINGNGFTWTVCFQLTAGPVSNCTNGTTDCSIEIKTYADAEIGVYVNIGCAGDQPFVSPASFVCCPIFNNPGAQLECLSYTLPTILGSGLTGNELYYTATNGGGTSYAPGDVINFADFPSYPVTLYIYDVTSCGLEEAFDLTISPNNTVDAASYSPVLCINTVLTPNVIHNTTGATGIANDGDDTGVNGLPTGVSATWSGDVITISGTPTESGSFSYSIPLTGGCGTVNATGTIEVDPAPTAVISGTNTICANGSTLLTFNLTGTGDFNVVYNDGTTDIPLNNISDGHTVSVSPATNTTYTLVSVLDNGTTCTGSISGSAVITVTPLPVASINPPATPICAGEDAVFVITGTPGATVTYTINGIAQPSVVLDVTTGEFTVTEGTSAPTNLDIVMDLTDVTLGSCSDDPIANETIVVNDLPVFTVSSTNPLDCITSDGTITISGLSAGTNYDLTYDGPSGSVGPTSITTIADGSFTLNGLAGGGYDNFVINDGTCEYLLSDPQALVPPGAPEFTISLGQNPATCVPGNDGEIIITGVTLGSNTINDYELTYTGPFGVVGPVVIPTDATGNYILTGLTAGNYTSFSIEDVNSSCVGSQPGPVLLTPPVDPAVGAVTTPTSVCSDNNVFTVEENGGAANVTWLWTSSSATITSNTDQIPTITNAVNGEVFTVTVTDAITGCTNSTTTNITVVPAPFAGAPNVASLCNVVGSTLDLNNLLEVGVSGGTWLETTGSGQFTAGTGVFNADGLTPGDYTFTYTVPGIAPCSAAVSNFTVTVTGIPNAGSNNSDVLCNSSGSSIDLNNLLVGADPGGTWSETTATASGQFTPLTGLFDGSGLAAGDYTFQYDLAPTATCSGDFSSFTVTVSNQETAGLDDLTLTICNSPGSTLDLNTALNGNSVIGSWVETTTSGQFTPGTGIFDASGLAAQAFTFEYTVNSTSPCLSDFAEFEINVQQQDDASFSLSPTCDGGTATISGISGGTFTFTAAPADGATIDANTGDITGGTPGSLYAVTYTTNGSCPNSSNVNVTALSLDDASFTTTATCDGGTAAISGITGGVFTFTNAPTDGAAIDGTTGTVSGGTGGTTYDITYTTNGTCTNSSSQTVTALTQDDAAFAMAPTCDGGTASITGAQGGTFSFTVPPSDGASIDASTGTITGGTAGGTYDVTYTTNGVCPNNSGQSITAYSLPPAPVSGMDSVYCSSWILEDMVASGSDPNGIITWYDSQNNVLSTSNTLTPNDILGTTEYFVTETLNGCEGPSSIVVITIENCEITIPTAITPNGDQINDTWEVIDLDAVYPDNIVQIYNRWGSLIFEHLSNSGSSPYNDNQWDGTYEGTELPVGSYYYVIQLNDDEGSVATGAISIVLD